MIHIPPIETFEDFEASTTAMLAPPPFASKFGAFTWGQIDEPSPYYEWLIDDLLPSDERAMIYGEPQSGKSFVSFDMAMAIAQGTPFWGRKTRKAGVIYCAFEGGKGFKTRARAYRLHHDLAPSDDVPIVILTRRADLFGSEEDIKNLKEEIEHWNRTLALPVGLTVFDTVSASALGMNENAGEEVSRFLRNVSIVTEGVKSASLLVHHKPKGGDTPRGSGKLTGDLETTIEVKFDPRNASDDNQRQIRIMKVTKQRESERDPEIPFVLRAVKVGARPDGRDVTSCVVQPPAGQQGALPVDQEQGNRGVTQDGRLILQKGEAVLFGALAKALETHGRRPPPHVSSPRDAECVTLANWRDVFAPLIAGEEEDAGKLAERAKKARDRGVERFLALGLIGKNGDWIWRTSKRTSIDRPNKKQAAPEPPPTQDDDDDDSIPF